MGSPRARLGVAADAQADLTRRLLAAVTAGDVPALEALLAEDVTVWTDGGGKLRAALRPVSGRVKVARLLLALTDGRLTHVGLVTATHSGVDGVYVIANPDKLRYAAAQLAVTTGGAVRSWRA